MHLLWILVVYDLILFPFGIPRMILKFILLVAERLSNTDDNILPREKIINHVRRKKTRHVRKINLPAYVKESDDSESDCENEIKCDTHKDAESRGSCDCIEEPQEPQDPQDPQDPQEPQDPQDPEQCVNKNA